MPTPLIIFENHLTSAARRWIKDQIPEWKKQGYKLVLFELDKTLSSAAHKARFTLASESLAFTIPLRQGFQLWIDIFNELEKNDMDYEFIDPETEYQAQLSGLLLAFARDLQDVADKVKWRDLQMAKEIQIRSSSLDGGVIYLGGFLHQHLIRLLKEDSENTYRYLLIHDSRDIFPPSSMVGQAFVTFTKDNLARGKFYGVEMEVVDYHKGAPVNCVSSALPKASSEEKAALVKKFEELTHTSGWKVSRKQGLQVWLEFSDIDEASKTLGDLKSLGCMNVEIKNRSDNGRPLIVCSEIKQSTLLGIKALKKSEPENLLSVVRPK